jgi:class 3 adenylate cyclase
MLSEEDIKEFAKEQFEQANSSASVIKFSAQARQTTVVLEAEHYMAKSARSLHTLPDFADIETSYGKAAWAAMLCVDIRGSTNREIEIGPKDTYLTVHTYLPTMVRIVADWNGSVVGLRGDGLIAAIGIHARKTNSNTEITPTQASKAVSDAVLCGKAMLESMEIINGILREGRVRDGLHIGVGIDVSDIVVTRIGLFADTELTAYGPSVSKASKFSGERNQICMSLRAKEMYPTAKDGKVVFKPCGKFEDAIIIDLKGHRVLKGKVKPR